MLSLQIYTSADGVMLADYSGQAWGVRFSTNKHGFAACQIGLVSMSLAEAFEVYEWPGIPHVVVSDSATGIAWEGRLEDIAIVAGGVSLTALGYQRAMYDIPYTALWSKSGTAAWRAVADTEVTGATPSQYEIDNNNRLYIAPRKGETYTNNSSFGEMTFAVPHNSVRNITNFSCNYTVLLPTNWQVRIYTAPDDFSGATLETTLTATGALQTGTFSLSVTANKRVRFHVRNATGGDSTITAETGVNFARLTGVRVKTSASSAIYADEIAAALVAYVSGVNASQLSTLDDLIEATTTDLFDELYEDVYPAAILDRLAMLHTAEWGVFEGRVLHFRPQGNAGRHWYVDATQILELQRSLENVRNSAYGVYRAANGGTLRTGTTDDEPGKTRYGLTRRGFVDVQTTSLSEAETHRNVWLSDRADMQPRARIEFNRVFDAGGGIWPLWSMRAGDTVTIRNLPPTLSSDIDRIRTFRIGETSYNAASGIMDIAPDDPTPTLVTLVARQEAGI